MLLAEAASKNSSLTLLSEILGKQTVHPFCIIHGLNENVILGADFINKHLLVYDPKFKLM